MLLKKILPIALVVFLGLVLISQPVLAAENHIGIVLLHGKSDTPEILHEVSSRLQSEGFIVETPVMPWSQARYIDVTYDQALFEIDVAVYQLKQRGAKRIIVAGHSMGANGALAYGAYKCGVDGVILLAPGFFPKLNKFQNSIALARKMVAEGRGEEKASFEDGTQGAHFRSIMRADVYLSFFAPQGKGNMRLSASKLNPNIPVLYVVGNGDRFYQRRGKEGLFDFLPANPYSRFEVVSANHQATKEAAVGIMINWMRGLPE